MAGNSKYNLGGSDIISHILTFVPLDNSVSKDINKIVKSQKTLVKTWFFNRKFAYEKIENPLSGELTILLKLCDSFNKSKKNDADTLAKYINETISYEPALVLIARTYTPQELNSIISGINKIKKLKSVNILRREISQQGVYHDVPLLYNVNNANIPLKISDNSINMFFNDEKTLGVNPLTGNLLSKDLIDIKKGLCLASSVHLLIHIYAIVRSLKKGNLPQEYYPDDNMIKWIEEDRGSPFSIFSMSLKLRSKDNIGIGNLYNSIAIGIYLDNLKGKRLFIVENTDGKTEKEIKQRNKNVYSEMTGESLIDLRTDETLFAQKQNMMLSYQNMKGVIFDYITLKNVFDIIKKKTD